MTSLKPEFTIRDDFPPVSYEQWRESAERALNGAPLERKLVSRTYEGIEVRPIYTRSDGTADSGVGLPGLSPFVRGSRPLGASDVGWDLCQEHAHPDLAVSNRAILDDVAGGANSVLLRLDSAGRRGLDPDSESAAGLSGRDGLTVYGVDDLDTLLLDVPLNQVGVSLESGVAFLPAAAALLALWRRREVDAADARGAFHADPLGCLAREGRAPISTTALLASMADLARFTSGRHPHVTAVGVDTSVYHDAGAAATQDIALGIATGVEYLRAMTAGGMDVDAAARQIVFRMSVGTHHFLSIAKLRAARRLWDRVVTVAGGSGRSRAMRIHARIGNRVLTRRDPYVNLLRNAVGVFSAGLGGAESITSVPFDQLVGAPTDFSRRVARNTLLVLQHEAHLNHVIDPAGGSWFLEDLTKEVAERAWSVFQEIERRGGMLQAIRRGWVAEQIEAAFAPRAKDIARRKQGITGVSEFPDAGQQRVVRPMPDADELRRSAAGRVAEHRGDDDTFRLPSSGTIDTAEAVKAATHGATIGQLAAAMGMWRDEDKTSSGPLPSRRFAEPFERLRDAADAWVESHGGRPRVFLAGFGPVADHTARVTYAKNFFEAGGFEVVTGDGFADVEQAAAAFAGSGARVAVICSSDWRYPDLVPHAAEKLSATGARCVVLAGNPGENEQTWRAAGVDRFIFVKCDVLATLTEMLLAEGVLES